MAAMYSGVVPQQPPTSFRPCFAISFTAAANSAGPISYSLLFGSGRPAFGLKIRGRSVHAAIRRMTGSRSRGPSEQLTPSAETPSPDSVSAALSGDTPAKVRPPASNVIVTRTGFPGACSLAARTAAFAS